MQGLPTGMTHQVHHVALPLVAAGITELSEVVSANGTQVLSATDLRRKFGRCIKTSQVHALHRIAYLLHSEDPATVNLKAADLSISAVEACRIRLIHPKHRWFTNPASGAGPASQAQQPGKHVTGTGPAEHYPSHQRTTPTTNTASRPGHADRETCLMDATCTLEHVHQQEKHAIPSATRQAEGQEPQRAGPSHSTPTSAPGTRPAPMAVQPRMRRARATAEILGMRCALVEGTPVGEEEPVVAGCSTGSTYTTRQQRAARWYSTQAEYSSYSQAVGNAMRAINAAGYNQDTKQARQIISWRQLTTGNAYSLRSQRLRHSKGTLHKHSQTQYLVEWQPSVLESWELALWQQLGYKALEATQVTHSDLAERAEYASYYDLLSCEICNKADAEEQLLQCDTCHRLYHTHCMHLQTSPAELDDDWSCCHCQQQQPGQPTGRCDKRHRTCEGAQTSQSANGPQQLIIVRWAPRVGTT